jgi:hypothetical protein
LETLLLGWGQALTRFRTADSDNRFTEPNPRLAFVSLFEALNWAVAIDARAGADDEAWWEGLPQGEIVRAVRFARNRVHHQWAAAVSGSITGGMVHGWIRARQIESGGWWSWRSTLPRPDQPRYADSKGEALYARHLAGQSVNSTFETLHGVFAHIDQAG